MATPDPVEAVLERLENVKYMRAGDYWLASCPTRRDRHPSMTVKRGEKGQVLFKDFGGATVDEIVVSLGMTMSDLFVDDPQERRRWMQEHGATATRERKPREYKKPELPEVLDYKEGATRWFASRGISEATMRHFSAFSGKRQFIAAGHSAYVALPYRKGEEIVNVKYRAVPVKDYLMETGAEPRWFNLDAAAGAAAVIVVEGEMDVLALFEAGITNAISPPNGSQSLTDEVWASGADLLGDEGVRVILAGDMDAAGEKLMDEVARRVGKERCARVRWPEGCKDANETLVAHDAKVVGLCVNFPDPLPVEGLIEVNDIFDRVLSLYDGGLPRGYSTGLRSLDEHYTVKMGAWTVVTAAPGSGKSNILDQIVQNLAENEDMRFGIASLENPDMARHLANIIPKRVRKPFGDRYPDRMSREELEATRPWFHEHFTFVRPEESKDLRGLLRAARSLVFAKGISGLILDPWNEMEHPPAGLNSGDYISRCLSMIRDFDFKHNLHIWLVAHPTKLIKDANGQYPTPTLYDISGSAHFFNKADFGLSMWRNLTDLNAPVEVNIQKSRFAEIAKLGMVKVGYDHRTTRYYDLNASGETDSSYDWRPTPLYRRMEEAEPQEFIDAAPDDFFAGVVGGAAKGAT